MSPNQRQYHFSPPSEPLVAEATNISPHLLSLLELHHSRIQETPYEKDFLFRHLCRGVKEILLAYLISFAEIAPFEWLPALLAFLETGISRIRALTYESPLYDRQASRMVATNYIPPLFTQLFNILHHQLDYEDSPEVCWKICELRQAYVVQLDNTTNLNLLKKDLHNADRLQLILLENTPSIVCKSFINEVIQLLKPKIEAFKRCQGRLSLEGVARMTVDSHKILPQMTGEMTHQIVHLVSLLIDMKTFMSHCETQFHRMYEADLKASLMIDMCDKTLRDTFGRKRFYKGRESFLRSFFRVREMYKPVIRCHDEFSSF